MEEKIKLIQSFLENVPLFNFISLILGIVGIVSGFVFYYKSRKTRLPTYAIRSINLVEDNIGKIGEIEISYANSKVKNLSIARVAFWNRGAETIEKSDVASTNPIKLVTLGTTNLLGIKIIQETNKANNFSLIPVRLLDGSGRDKQNEMIIDFDYIDYNEGIILQVFHTGKNSDDLKIEGVVKGCGPVKKLSESLINKFRPVSLYVDNIKQRNKKYVLGSLLILTPIFGLITQILPTPKIVEISPIIKFLPTLLLFLAYWPVAISILRRRVPKGLDLFEEKLKP